MKRVIALGAALLVLPVLVRLLIAQGPPPSQAPPPPPTYTLTDLGPLNVTAAPSGATALNASGQITGFRFENFTTPVCFAGGANRAFLWDKATNPPYIELGTLGTTPNLGASSSAYGINNAGQIVGSSDYCPNGNSVGQRAFIWQNGVMTALDPSTNSNDSSAAFAVNMNGDVAGYINHANTGVGYQPVIWKGGTAASLTVLAPLGCQFSPDCQGKAFAINDSGQAAGWAIGAFVRGYNHAVMWDSNGQPTDLGSFGRYFDDQANAINSRGDVVGYSQLDPDVYYSIIHAVLWKNGDPQNPQDLGTIPRIDPLFGTSANITDNSSSAWGINSKGDVVGISGYGSSAVTLGNGGRAFLYTNGTMYDLLTLLAPGTNWRRLEAPWAINDNGQILGVGIDANQQEHGFLLTPVITPTTTAVTSSVSPSVFAQQVSFTATVTPNQSSALTPTGNVTFNDTLNNVTTALGTVSLTSGTAIFNTAGLAVGSHTITVSYAGDNNFASSTSAALNQTVNQAPTMTTLAVSPNPATFGQAVTLTATITAAAPGAGTPTGAVTFLDGTITPPTTLGTGTLNSAGNATFSTSSLAPGSHNITVSYGGDPNFAVSASQATSFSVVLTAPTITSPVSGSSTTNSSVIVTGTGTPGATVAILEGTTTVGTTAVNAAGSFTTTITLAIGTHSLTATQSLNAVTSAASATVNITIAPTAPAITSPASGFSTTNPLVIVTGTGMPGASVAVLDGTTQVGTGTADGAGNFSLSITLAVGAHSLTATQTLNGIKSAASAAVTVSISLPPVVITDNETITVSDTPSFPDVFQPEAVRVTDAVFVTPLINVGAPVADYSAGSLGFGNVAAGQTGTQSLTLSDIGQAPLVVSSAVTSPGSAFTISQIACSNGAASLPITLPAGGVCTLLISYAAPSGAAVNDVLTFTDNAPLSNVSSAPAGTSYTQHIALNGSGTTTPPPPPPPAVVPVLDNETIHVTDAEAFPDVFDPEPIKVADQVAIQVLNTTTTSISIGGGSVYGTPVSVVVSVGSATAPVTGNVTLSVDGGTPTTLPLSSGSATFNLGVLKAGNHSLVANFPAQGNFTGSSAQATLVVNQATPTITWANPAAIPYGTQLSGAQMNATASVPGSFVYSPAAGTVLSAGSHILSLTFSPTDSTDYTTATATVMILVLNTLVGTNIGVTPVDITTGLTPVTLNYSNVTKAGVTSLATSSAGVPPPPAFQPGVPPVYYDISTTATFTGPATICIHYSGITFTQPPHLFHLENGVWVDRTTSIDPVNMIVCGTVPSFSPFALFAPLPVLTITANSIARQYGRANPAFAVSYNGFVNGDTPSVLSGTLSCVSPATSASAIGAYPITCSGLTSSNYIIKFGPGVLTITPAPLTVTAANAQRVYGAPNPIFTGTITGIQNADNITATHATAATPTSPVGMYAIVPTLVDPGGKLGNYFVTMNNGVLIVIQASTTTALSAAPNPSNFGQMTTLTATVAPVAPGAGTATGKVTFLDGSITLGTSTLNSADTATFTTSALVAGSHSLTAAYTGDPNFSGSSSSAVSDQVVCGVLINLSPATVPLGGTVTVTANVVSCSSTTQTLVVQFLLSGPSQPNSCSSTKSVMFTTPPFPLAPKTSQTVSFPFKVPSGACPGSYSITATTHANSATGPVLNTSTASLTITAH